MHGCGNDYIYVDTAHDDIPNPSEAAILLSDRHKGIGSDGLVLIGRSPTEEADFTMRIFNADGSEAMMCGNASRCIGKYVYERGLTEKKVLRLLTPSGIKVLMLNVEKSLQGNRVESVTVDMGEPQVADSQLSLGDEALSLSMGNPHHVVFVGDVENMDVASEGARLEYHPQLPERSNVEFAEVRPEGIRMRVWERGSGITMACGTGACATAVAACLTGRAGRTSRIMMDGGTLTIEWCAEDRSADGRRFQQNHVYMTGPATFVFDGEVEMARQSRK
jgi:diaminopimelate epimerase